MRREEDRNLKRSPQPCQSSRSVSGASQVDEQGNSPSYFLLRRFISRRHRSALNTCALANDVGPVDEDIESLEEVEEQVLVGASHQKLRRETSQLYLERHLIRTSHLCAKAVGDVYDQLSG